MLERDDAAVGAVVHAQVVLSLMRRVGCRARAAWTTAQLTWLRAEACCECTKEAHGHRDRCNQFVVWADRGGTGKGA